MSRRRAVARAGPVLFACAAASCLPAGDPPAGRHLLSDRAPDQIAFLPAATAGGPARLLIAGPGTTPDVSLVTAADGSASGGSVSPRLLLDGVSAWIDCLGPVCRPRVLADGRILLTQPWADPARPDQLVRHVVRVDPDTGDKTDLGPIIDAPVLSPARRRVAIASAVAPELHVREPDDRETVFTHAYAPQFLGEDLYFIDQSADPSVDRRMRLRRFRDGATADEVVADGAAQYFFVPVPDGPLLIPCRPVDQNNPPAWYPPCAYSSVDLETLAETPIPSAPSAGYLMSASPSGRWLMFSTQSDTSPDSSVLVLLDRTTGDLQSIAPPGWTHNQEWRPGKDELWIQLFGETAPELHPSIWTWRPDGMSEVPGRLVFSALRQPENVQGTFTRDGQHWFSVARDDWSQASVLVGRADDPAGEMFTVNPPGTRLGQYWELDDGRLLVEASVGSRFDMSLLDPDTGVSRLLATGGFIVALGRSRALAMVDWVGGTSSGSLTLIDLETGATRLLGEDVFRVAVEWDAAAAVATGDALAPGVRVAFLVRNRIVSPYDGLWLTVLP